MPYPGLLHPEPLPLRQATADLNPTGDAQTQPVSVSVGSLGPGVHKVCLSPLSLAGMEFDFKSEFAPPTILLGFLLCPWRWGVSSQMLQHLPSYWGFTDLARGVSSQGHHS